MSGFLGHLIARSFGLAETIRPRAPSLFEPRPEERMLAPPAEIDAPGDAEEFVAAPDAADPTVDLSRPRGRNALATTRAPLEPPGRAKEETDALASSPSDAARRPQMAPVPPAAVPSPIGPFEAPFDTPRASADDPSPDAPAMRDSIDTVAPTRDDAPDAANTLQAAESFPHADAPVETGSRVARSAAPATVRLRIAPAARAQQQAAGASRASRFESRARATATEPEPTIQVTIGRIEIRAEAAARAPAKERAGPKPMSLDDYLRRRQRSGP